LAFNPWVMIADPFGTKETDVSHQYKL